MKKYLPLAAVLLSGILLVLSFAPFELGVLAWVAFVPLFFVCSGATVRRAAFFGWVSGFVFFIGSLFWLRHVSWLGYVALAAYCALYFIPFAVFIALRPGGWRSSARLANLKWMAGAALVWAASEYVRSFLLTGFPWNLLAVSQYTQTSLIQIAEWGGVYALSALIIFVNAGVAVTALQYVSGLRSSGYRMHVEFMSVMFVLAFVSSVGLRCLLASEAPVQPVRAMLIQPNIPEVGNWALADPEVIYETLETLTETALHVPGLDLIIWPETALPDVVRYSPRSAELVKKLTASGPPLLVGSMDATFRENAPPSYYNASLLFDSEGALLDIYRKQHLVLFGEYIPFAGKIPWINALTPIPSSFLPGEKSVVFTLPSDERGFSVLICFEDTLPKISRRAAQAGATWLVNQTNDSWFDPGAGSQQHMAHAVFRCVETRLPMVRCANTGITCHIDSRGRMQKQLAPRMEGFQTVEVHPSDPTRPLTFYTRHGDRFAQACLLGSIALFITFFVKTRKNKPCLKS